MILFKNMKQTIKVLFAFMTVVLMSSGSILYAEKTEEIIVITKTVQVKTGHIAKGTVEIYEKELNFEGPMLVDGSVEIRWNKINDIKFKPPFLSKFLTKSTTIRTGTKIKINGNFAKIVKSVEKIEKKKEQDKLSGEDGSDGEDVSLSDSESAKSDLEVQDSAGQQTAGGSSPTTDKSTSPTEVENNTPTVVYEMCTPVIDGSTIKLMHKSIATYPNGSVETGSCVSKASYPIVNRPDGCSIRHDYSEGASFEQQKKVYYDAQANEIEITTCADTGVSYAHAKMIGTCESLFDQGTSREYKQKKTYYVARSGELIFITGCQVDANDTKQFTDADKQREYINGDKIDREAGYAYKMYREYIQIGDQKIYVSDPIIDLNTQMQIVKDYEKCEYYDDNTVGYSYKQYAEVYYSEGARNVVSDCRPDQTYSYAHKTDDRFCDPKINDNKLYRNTSTYFIDQVGVMQSITSCQMTDYELVIDRQNVGKDFTACDPKVDLVNKRAIGYYREQLNIGDRQEYISICLEDPDKIYPFQEVEADCRNLVDTENQKAYQQKRSLYDTGLKKVYVTQCTKTENEFHFETSGVDCSRTISEDGKNYLESEETFYRDFTGQKRIVTACHANGTIIMIPEGDIFKNYEMCSVELNMEDSRAYRRYKKYVTIAGAKKVIAECQQDPNSFYEIYKTTTGCNVRVDMNGLTAYQQERSYYNNGLENVYINSCMDSEVTYPFEKSTVNCSETISADKATIMTQEETFYINENAEKIVVSECAPNGVQRLVANEPLEKRYDCDDYPNYEEGIVYTQYSTYMKLNGNDYQVKGCLIDFEKPTYTIQKDYENCEDKIDMINMKATVQAENYYSKDGEDKYLTACGETEIEYPIIEDKTTCEKIPVPETNKVVFQSRLYYVNKSGEAVEAKECYPTAEEGVIEERLCTPTFVHDEIANQSYYYTRFAYDNAAGEEIIIKPCQYSVTKPMFQHKVEICGYEHDNTNLRSTLKQRKYITDENGDEVIINDCIATEIPVPYAYIITQKDGWINATQYGSPSTSGCNSNRLYNYSSKSTSYTRGGYIQTNIYYLRADGTKYLKEVGKDCISVRYCRKTSYLSVGLYFCTECNVNWPNPNGGNENFGICGFQ